MQSVSLVTVWGANIPVEVCCSFQALVVGPDSKSLSARLFFFISVLRNAFVVIVLTFAAWLYTRHRKSKSGKYPIKILGTVPRGFKHAGAPHIDSALVTALAPQLPVATIILLLEHIAISKCMLNF